MTARDEAIDVGAESFCMWLLTDDYITIERGAVEEAMKVVLDAIPTDVLRRLADERGDGVPTDPVEGWDDYRNGGE